MHKMLTSKRLLSRERRQCDHNEDQSNVRSREVKKNLFKWVRLNNISKLTSMFAMINVLWDSVLKPVIFLFEVKKHFLKHPGWRERELCYIC